jgi:hypothetical protein
MEGARWRFSTMALGLCAIVLITHSTSSGAALLLASRDPAVEADPPGGGCGVCAPDCALGGGAFGHIALQNPDGSRIVDQYSAHGDCRAGGCDGLHPFSCACFCANDEFPDVCYVECTQSPGGAEEHLLLGSVAFAEISSGGELSSAMARSLAAKYRNVELNELRGAIQLVGCHSAVVAHIPFAEEIQ